jgi:hypothetical protein
MELAHFQEGPADVVVVRDGPDLVFTSAYDDYGRRTVEECRLPVADFLAKGPGPWPWFDLGARREVTLQILEALGVAPPAWTHPLTADNLNLFDHARRGDSWVIEMLAMGADPDPVDACGASPLWYGLRSRSAGIAVALIDAGADAGRHIELSACGDRFTTILHEIVRIGRTVALKHALAAGVNPSLSDSDGATPMHVLGSDNDNVNPEIVRNLARAGASVGVALPSGTQPIELAARRMLPATVAALVELGAEPDRGLDALLSWWSVGARFAGHRAVQVADIIDILRAGGARLTPRHRELAAAAGASEVQAAVRR